MKRALVIEDDHSLAKAVVAELTGINFVVEHASNGTAGLEMALAKDFDVIILDLMLPGLEGAEVCRGIRKANAVTPILIVTARNTEADAVLLLELGADDYITKPFSLAEFRARVKAAVRRGDISSQPDELQKAIIIGDLKIDPAIRKVTRDEQDLGLTAREFDYVYYLASNPSRVISRDELSQHVQGYDGGNYEHSVNSAINRIRSKIEIDSANPKYILTIRGAGYRFGEP